MTSKERLKCQLTRKNHLGKSCINTAINWNTFQSKLKRWAHITHCIQQIGVGDSIKRKYSPKQNRCVKNVKELILSTRVERPKIFREIG